MVFSLSMFGKPEHIVQLWIYDLSKGKAKQLAKFFGWKGIDALWHTTIMIHGREVWYGYGSGIKIVRAGTSPLGAPDETIDLGKTTMNLKKFERWITSIRPQFPGKDYHVLEHNCNSFTQFCAIHLCKTNIPDHIRDLPTAFESSRIGKILVPYIKEFYEAMKQGDSGAMDERRRKIHAKAMQAIRLIGSSS